MWSLRDTPGHEQDCNGKRFNSGDLDGCLLALLIETLHKDGLISEVLFSLCRHPLFCDWVFVLIDLLNSTEKR